MTSPQIQQLVDTIKTASPAIGDAVVGFGIGAIVFGIIFVVSLVLVGCSANDLIQKATAPDYAAIQNLASLIPTGSH